MRYLSSAGAFPIGTSWSDPSPHYATGPAPQQHVAA